MTLATDEFIRRFLIHVLPRGFHRIRHYGLLASGRAPTTSRERVSCSTCRRHSPRPAMTSAPRPTNPSRSRTPARAAAVA